MATRMIPFLISGLLLIMLVPVPGLVAQEDNSMQDLLTLITGDDTLAAEDAAYRIVQFGNTAVPKLVKLLQHEKRDARASALLALGLIGDSTASAPVLQFLEKLGAVGASDESFTSEYLRHEAIKTLGRLGDKNAIPILRQVLTGVNRHDKAEAWIALARLGEPDAFGQIIELLGEEQGEIRNIAVKGLGALRNPAAVKPLMELISDPEWYVRDNTLEALGAIGDKRARSAVEKALEDKNPFVRRTAKETLKKL